MIHYAFVVLDLNIKLAMYPNISAALHPTAPFVTADAITKAMNTLMNGDATVGSPSSIGNTSNPAKQGVTGVGITTSDITLYVFFETHDSNTSDPYL